MGTSTRNINVSHYDDEYALFGKALPYIAMLIGAGLAFVIAVITRIGIWSQNHWGNMPFEESSKAITWILIVSCVLLSALAWKLFRPRDIVHYYISWHAVVTTILIHAWLIMAVWQDKGDWIFGAPTVYAYFFGGAIVGISWCIRRWAYRGDMNDEGGESSSDIWDVIGLGKEQGPEKTLGTESLRWMMAKARWGILSSWTWITARLSKMQKRNSQK